jgi:polysaccharide pyruvyl transferase WcaK-like protein
MALTAATQRSFRDEGSLALARQCGMRGAAYVCPDPALGLSPAALTRMRQSGTIAVSPVSHRTWRVAADAEYEAYLKTLTRACNHWLGLGYRLRFVCSETEMDPLVVGRVLGALDAPGSGAVDVAEARTPEAFCGAATGADVLVTSRLHGAILGMVAGTPILALSPARKVSELMREAGLAEYCLALHGLDLDAVLAAAEGLKSRRDVVSSTIERFTRRATADLQQSYDRLAAVVP